MSKRKDLTGQVFERLTVLEFSHIVGGFAYWKCQCVCGNLITVRGTSLRNSHSRSCGCLQKAMVSGNAIKHGHTANGQTSSEYGSWSNMIKRCTNPNLAAYRNYGGRGITVCKQWLNSFETFLEDMGLKPFPGAEIDRSNNNGNYEPANCRWVTHYENQRNKRR